MLADLYGARIVAMLSAVNSKARRYEPERWMTNSRELMRRKQEAPTARRPLTGEEVIQRFRMLGVPIRDKRTKKD
jgi:hypothetical protein